MANIIHLLITHISVWARGRDRFYTATLDPLHMFIYHIFKARNGRILCCCLLCSAREGDDVVYSQLFVMFSSEVIALPLMGALLMDYDICIYGIIYVSGGMLGLFRHLGYREC